MQSTENRFEWVIRVVFMLMIATTLYFLISTLYVFPIPDSAHWYGDESWLMLEARTQILTGVLKHPYAFGATISHSLGVLGSTWISSIIYGIPAAIFRGDYPVILIGRTVTFFIVLVALFELSRLLYRTTKRVSICAVGVLLLTTSPSFELAAHSCRPDLIIGLVVLLVVGYFAKRVDNDFNRPMQWFGFGAIMTLLGFTIALHLATLLGPYALYLLYQKGGFRKWENTVFAIGGAAFVAGVLGVVYYISTGDFSLFGAHGQHVQFVDVVYLKPIFRPFSRSVQWNNITQRITLLRDGAPAVLILWVIVSLKVVIDILRKRAEYLREPEVRFIAISTLVIFLSWLLFQTSIEYYVPHFLLLAVFAGMLGFDRSILSRAKTRSVRLSFNLALVALFVYLTIATSERLNLAGEVGRQMSAENHRAELKLFADMKRDAAARGIKDPLVVSESPCAIWLETDCDFNIMAPFFTSFPDRDESVMSTFKRYHVDYALLYETPLAMKIHSEHDSLSTAINRDGHLLDTAMGKLFDVRIAYDGNARKHIDEFELFKIDGR